MRPTIIMMITILVLLSGNMMVFSSEESVATGNSYDDYKVIFERNIFSKDRLPPRETKNGSERARTTQVLAIYILRGIAAQQDQKIAFIEEQISGQSMKAEIGAEVLNGRITDIKYDRVAFEENGQIKYIKVGGEFGKTETTVVVTASEELQETSAEEKPAEASNGGGESDILKKLMERRQAELGQ